MGRFCNRAQAVISTLESRSLRAFSSPATATARRTAWPSMLESRSLRAFSSPATATARRTAWPSTLESRSLRAFSSHVTATGIRTPVCRPSCSCRLARPMSVWLCVRARSSIQPPSGTFIANLLRGTVPQLTGSFPRDSTSR